MIAFLVMIGIFGSVSLFSYYNERYLLKGISDLLTNNIELKGYSAKIDNVVTSLERFLISGSFDMLREYHTYSQEVDALYRNLNVVEGTEENYLLLENIKNMSRSFLQQTEGAVQAKRSRDSSGYNQAFNQVVRYSTNIRWALDRLIIKQLEGNSRKYLLISERIIYIQRLGLFLILSSIIFSAILTIWVTYRLTLPLQNLVKAAESISKGDFSVKPLDVSSNDEISIVAGAFNEMVAGISKFIAEIKRQSDLEKKLQEQELQNLSMRNVVREAELHALQSQINPHFLFNTLNVGVQLANIEEAQRTAEFVDKVSQLLRYNLHSLDTPVTIRRETEHLETYFFILKTRYGDNRIQFKTSISPEVNDFPIPLLTLQPIVENALIHGVEGLERGGEISVLAYRDGNNVIIKVIDNGLGMDDETLKRVQEREQAPGHTTGLGLHNVRERLRLFYGEEDLLAIDSTPNQGTTIRLLLPAQKWGGDDR